MCYTERVDLGRCKVFAEMVFVNNGTNTYHIGICKDTDDEVIVPQRSHKVSHFQIMLRGY